MKRIGLAFPGQPYRISTVVAAAREAETAGFDSVWFAEDCWTGRDSVTLLTCAAMSTNRIALGTAVVNPYTRHPVLTAMTFNTLRELASGRLRLGIASGLPWKPLVETAVREHPPLRALRDAVTSCRTLLSGGELHFGNERVSLHVERPCFEGAMSPDDVPIPVYMGASGPKMSELAGEIADGLLLGTGTSPLEAQTRIEDFKRGGEKAGRAGAELDRGVLVVADCSEDGSIHPNILSYAVRSVTRQPPEFLDRLGIDRELVSRIREADCERARSLLTREMIRQFVVAGTVDDCLETLNDYQEAGIKLPLLLPFGGRVENLIHLGKIYGQQI